MNIDYCGCEGRGICEIIIKKQKREVFNAWLTANFGDLTVYSAINFIINDHTMRTVNIVCNIKFKTVGDARKKKIMLRKKTNPIPLEKEFKRISSIYSNKKTNKRKKKKKKQQKNEEKNNKLFNYLFICDV